MKEYNNSVMTQRERFYNLFTGKPVDRIPIYFFGTWHETKIRWKNEGCNTVGIINCDEGPQIEGMDTDWENGMWNCHGMVDFYLRGDKPQKTLEETDNYVIISNSVGDIVQISKLGSSINHTLEYALKPTRESWESYKRYLDASDGSRYFDNWESIAESLNGQDRVVPLMGGSLYGYLRNFLGIENLSCLMYDDEELFEDMLSYMTDFYIELFTPIVKKVKFDLVYIFEDCCGANGPLFSPELYKKYFDKYYRKLLSFYKQNGIPLSLIDSDGKTDKLINCWLESSFDIMFPIENGIWKQTPSFIRQQYGKDIKMMGGIDKHVIVQGADELRKHFLTLKSEVDKGGYLPLPDHRIPPECSYTDFLNYVKIFNEVFNKVD